MKHQLNRIFSLLMALVFCVGLLGTMASPTSAAETSGNCGENLEWSFADGLLTITGSGEMTDYSQRNFAPWYEFRDEIFSLSLPEGLTSVGDMAFYDCYNLVAITIPSTVTEIGQLAFCQCRNVKILTFSGGVKSIGRSAFEQCESLQDLRLPDGLTALGHHAFYRCAALRYVTVPATVEEMDSGVFAYCSKLICVEMQAPIDTVPAWSFYGCNSLTTVVLPEETVATEDNAFSGCENLHTVHYTGDEEKADQIKEYISQDEEHFGQFGTVTSAPVNENVTSVDTSVGENGELIIDSTVITKTDTATISTTTSHVTTETGKTAQTQVTATVVTEDGWQQVIEAIKDAQGELQNQEQEGSEIGNVDVSVYVSGSTEVPKDVLDTVADSNVELTVETDSGSRFSIIGSVLEQTDVKDNLELSYVIAYMAVPDHAELNGIANYKLRFKNSSEVKVEVMIRMPTSCARKTASLYQISNNQLQLLQNVRVDSEGYAHFYLASVHESVEYRIGVDVQNIDPNSVIIPEDLYSEYGVNHTPPYMEYVITGRTSSWGMNMTQVTLILMAVMVASAVAVGVIMYLRNKKKLRDGYVPDISEEDLEE